MIENEENVVEELKETGTEISDVSSDTPSVEVDEKVSAEVDTSEDVQEDEDAAEVEAEKFLMDLDESGAFINNAMDRLEDMTRVGNLLREYGRRKAVSDRWARSKPVGTSTTMGVPPEITDRKTIRIKGEYDMVFGNGIYFKDFSDIAMRNPTSKHLLDLAIGKSGPNDINAIYKAIGLTVDEKGRSQCKLGNKIHGELQNRLGKEHSTKNFISRHSNKNKKYTKPKVKDVYWDGGYATTPSNLPAIESVIINPMALIRLLAPKNREEFDKLDVDGVLTAAYGACTEHISNIITITHMAVFSKTSNLDRHCQRMVITAARIIELYNVLSKREVLVYPESFKKFRYVSKRDKENNDKILETTIMDVFSIIEHPIDIANATLKDAHDHFYYLVDLSTKSSKEFKKNWDKIKDLVVFPANLDHESINEIKHIPFPDMDSVTIDSYGADIEVGLEYSNLRVAAVNLTAHSDDPSKYRKTISRVCDSLAKLETQRITEGGESKEVMDTRLQRGEYIATVAEFMNIDIANSVEDITEKALVANIAYDKIKPVIAIIADQAATQAGLSKEGITVMNTMTDWVEHITEIAVKLEADAVAANKESEEKAVKMVKEKSEVSQLNNDFIEDAPEVESTTEHQDAEVKPESSEKAPVNEVKECDCEIQCDSCSCATEADKEDVPTLEVVPESKKCVCELNADSCSCEEKTAEAMKDSM